MSRLFVRKISRGPDGKPFDLEQRKWSCDGRVELEGCILCGESEADFQAEENGFPIVRCKSCGLVYVNPRPSEKDVEAFYGQYLRPEVSGRWDEITRALFKRDAIRIGKFAWPGRLLDIGCGFGFFLNAMREQGWDTYGSDLSEVAVEYATSRLGLKNVFRGQVEELHFKDSFFDVITCWFAMDLMPHPGRVILEAKRILKGGGILAMRVPNFDFFKILWTLRRMDCSILRFFLSLIRKETGNKNALFNVIDPPVHSCAFTSRVLSDFLEKNGFRVLHVFNDGMVRRGNFFNRIFDGGITYTAEVFKLLTRGKKDLSISFSIYAKKL